MAQAATMSAIVHRLKLFSGCRRLIVFFVIFWIIAQSTCVAFSIWLGEGYTLGAMD